MPLADFQPERTTITYKDKPLAEVRGLNLGDISVLVRAHMAELQRFYELVQAGNPGTTSIFERLKVDDFIFKLITDLPNVAALMIALACDDRNQFEVASTLPLPLQIKILHEVVRLTFEDVGGPKGFVALVASLMGTVPVEQATKIH